MFKFDKQPKPGFTIVELLVVIVVIGILAAISFVSYAGITERAIAARLQSDLSNNTKLLELYKIEHDEYPATLDDGTGGTNCPLTPEPDDQYCLKVSEDDDTLTYEGDGGTGGGAGDTYTLTITDEDSGKTYEIVPGGNPVAVESGVGSGAVGTTFVNAWGGVDYEDAFSITQTSDGGYAITGMTTSYDVGGGDVFIAKFASDGTLSWNKTWGGADYDYGKSIIQTSDNGYIVTGQSDSYDSGGGDAFIAKFTSDGTFSWNKTWGGANLECMSTVIQTSDGGYLAAGVTDSYGAGSRDSLITKFTSDGTMSWSKTWGGASTESLNSIIQTSDGGFAISGIAHGYGAGNRDAFLARFTSDGTLSWSRTWGGSVSYDSANSLIQSSDNGFAITGFTRNFGAGHYDAFIAKFTSDGTLSWDRTWGGVNYDEARSILQDSDGGYVIAGIADLYGVSNDAFIAKFTSDGTFSWDRIWGGSASDSVRLIIKTSDGGYALAGNTDGYSTGDSDAFIIKYDASLNIEGCPAHICKTPSASVSDPSATVTSPTATVTSPTASISSPSATISNPSATFTLITPIAPIIPPPPMTEIFSAQELYVAWPGDDQTVCKEWTVPNGKTIKGFAVSQETETNYDFFTVSSDGVEKYNESGYITDSYINISATPGTVLSACMVADSSTQDGYGGQVTGVLYD